MPDGFFRTELAKAAAGEAAADRKRQRDKFAGEKRRQPDEHANGDGGGRPVDQSRQEATLERQVGGLVAKQQTGGDAGGQQDPEGKCENEPIGPGPILENQNMPEPSVPHEHRR
jgi:hypothetical protein